MSNAVNKLREFGNFRLYVEEKELWHDNEPISLPEKAVDVLVELTSSPGQIVKKETLTLNVWSATEGAENSLTQAVHMLRKAFRQYGENDLIKTVPRRGYRFVGEITNIIAREDPEQPLSPAIPAAESGKVSRVSVNRETLADHSAPLIAPRKNQNPRFRFAAAIGGFLLLILVSGFAIWKFGKFGSEGAFGSVNSIAVLPLTSSGEVDESLRMRITDSVITRLSEINWIRVRPTGSVHRYVDSLNDPVSLGKELKVDAVFDGSVEIEDNVLSVELRAISTLTGEQLWSDRFIGEADRLLSLQDVISERILGVLRSQVSDSYSLELAENPTHNAEAYENYLKGRYFWQRRTFDGLNNAIAYYQRAIELDPEFALAYVGLADAYYLLYDYNYDPSKENVDRAKSNLTRAIELDPNSEQAYVTLGLIYTTYEWDWEKAGRSFDAAIQIRPDSAEAYHRRAMMHLKHREFAKAETDIRRALELEPTSLGINMNLGVVLYFAGRYEDAIRQFMTTIAMDETFPAPRWYLARCHWQAGNKERSIDAYLEAMRLSGRQDLAATIDERRKSVDVDGILAFWIDDWKKAKVGEHSLAILASHQNDTAATLRLLNEAVESRHPWASSIYAEPEFAFLKDDPEFAALVRRIGIVQISEGAE